MRNLANAYSDSLSSLTPKQVSNLSLRGLEAFHSVVETGSATGAAKLMGISQPAISRLLKQLEEDLGVMLFTRKRGRLTPTQEAERLREDVASTLAAVDRIRLGSNQNHRLEGTPLRLAVTPMMYQYVLLPILPKLLASEPELVFTLEIGNSDAVSDWLLREQVEIGMASLLDRHPGIEAEPLISTSSICLLPKYHPLTKLEIIRPENLAPFELVTMTRRFSSRHRIEQIFRKAKIPLKIRAETNVAGTMVDLVRAGSGVAILNRLSWLSLENRDLMARPFQPALRHRYGFLSVADRSLTLAARTFKAYIHEYIRNTIPDEYVELHP